jgi:glycosyltransferase involved in cell wall biosynthesis
MLTIITCANRNNKYFEIAARSCVEARNNNPNVELLLVANGGWIPDEKIKKYYDEIIYTDKNGLGYARNLGVEASKGTWVTFFDSDDMLNVNYVNKTIEYILKKCEINYFYNTILTMSENGEINHAWVSKLSMLPTWLAIKIAHPYTGATLVIKKEYFKINGGYTWAGYAEDYDLSLKLYENNKNKKPSINLNSTYYYRQHVDTMSGNLRKKIIGIKSVQWHHVIFHKNYSMLLGVIASTARLIINRVAKNDLL